MSKSTTTNDALITPADIQAFKDEVNRGRLSDLVFDLISQEPELGFYLVERYSKTLESLQKAGVEGRRMAALSKYILLTIWGAVFLIHRAQRRQWNGFLPAEETKTEGGDQ
ncbi:MAG TPA: hypothetical protein VGG19_17090 [Tepidisphaeraceae bacterium]|jgi:hypothetical protein